MAGGEISCAGNVYSFGAMLYELLAASAARSCRPVSRRIPPCVRTSANVARKVLAPRRDLNSRCAWGWLGCRLC